MNLPLFPVLLASASSLLPPPLWAAMDEASFLDGHSLSFLLMLAAAPGIAALAALIRYLGRPSADDKANDPIEPLIEVESDELAPFMRDTVEQLNCIAAELRSTTDTPLKAGQGREGNRGSLTAPENIAEQVGTVDETASQTTLLALSGAIEEMRAVTSEQNLAELAAKMHKLTELANHLHEERRALSRTANGPLLTMETSGSTAQSRHYLAFTLGDEQFAVSTQSIHGVVEAIQLVAEPSMPPKIRKAIRLRGALVPVIDLGARFGGQPIEIGWSSRIVILEVTSGDRLQMIGVVVDAVGKVLEIPSTEIEPPAASDSRIRDDFTLGTVTVDNRPVTLLDIGRGFSANELIVLRSAARSTKQENELA